MIKTSLKVLGHLAYTGFGFMLSVISVDVGMHWGRINASVVQGVPYEEAVTTIPGWIPGFIIIFVTVLMFIMVFPLFWFHREEED